MAKHSKRQRVTLDESSFATQGSNVIPMTTGRKQRRQVKDQQSNHIKPLEFKTQAQYHYAEGIKTHSLTFGLGPAGTGKTHIATALAAAGFLDGTYTKIVVTRPMVGGDEEEMGALPGTMQEKFEPWFGPVRDILDKCLGKGAVECHLKNGNIVIAPLQHMRGATFEDAFVIMDEAQNTTKRQMEMFLTRMGPNSTVVVNGDIDQTDLKGAISGLKDASKRLLKIEDIFFFEFTARDVIRHRLLKKIMAAYHPKYKKDLEEEEAEEREDAEGSDD